MGRATHDVGVCVNMMYNQDNSGSSGAYTRDLAAAFVNDFGFYRAKYVKIASTNDYSKLIFSDLCKTNPVVLGIHGLSGGHEILGVGYGEDDDAVSYTRLFMGWGGHGDAWYNLPDIRPSGNMAFSVVDDAIISILPQAPPGMHQTLDEAKAAAAASMKPILLVSGTVGDAAAEALLTYVQANYPGEFEIYFADFESDPYADLNPSYGVFNPLVFDRDSENRWAFYNGRLAYSTDTTDEAIAKTLDAGLENWGIAYSDYLRLQEAATNGITVNESGSYYLGDELWPVSGDTVVYENQFTNGQEVVFYAAPSPVTNLTDGIVWGVAGWNVFSWDGNSVGFISGSDTNATFTVASNTVYSLSWIWSAEAVRLTTGPGTGGSVSPSGETWYPYGSTANVMASPNKGSYNWYFDHWAGHTNGCEMAGSVIQVPMDAPRDITAYFRQGGTSATANPKYTLTLAADPAEVTAPVAYGVRSLSYGANTLLNGAMAASVPETWEDATGGVWRCTGWTGTGSVPVAGTETVVGFDLAEDSSITWLWEPKPVTTPDPPIGPVEGGVTNSALVIYATNDTQLAVQTRVSNAKAGYWYSIWSADAVDGQYAYVAGPYAGTAKQKVVEPVPELLVLTIVFDPVEAAKFYRVVVTEEDPEQ